VFPIGIILNILTGCELFTGNTSVLMFGLFSRKWTTKKFIYQYCRFSLNLLLSFVFNVLGAFFVAYFFAFLVQPCCTAHYVTFSQNFAVAKVSRSFGRLVLSGMACNILVVSAVYSASAASTVEGKILGIWFPIMTFVASGLDNCVSNSFFIPLGMLVSSFGIGLVTPSMELMFQCTTF